MILIDSNISSTRTTALSNTSPFSRDDHVPVHQAVGGVRVVAAHVDGHAGGAGGRPERAVVDDLLPASARRRPSVRAWISGSSTTAPRNRSSGPLQAVEHLPDGREVLGPDVPAHAARLHHGVVVPVAGDQLEDVEHVLAVAPRPHPHRVEPEEVAGQPQPQQVRVDALQLARSASGCRGRAPGPRCRPASSTACTQAIGMRGRADAADALHQEDGLLEVLATRRASRCRGGCSRARCRGGPPSRPRRGA